MDFDRLPIDGSPDPIRTANEQRRDKKLAAVAARREKETAVNMEAREMEDAR